MALPPCGALFCRAAEHESNLTKTYDSHTTRRDAIAVVITRISISHFDRVADPLSPFLGPCRIVLPPFVVSL